MQKWEHRRVIFMADDKRSLRVAFDNGVLNPDYRKNGLGLHEFVKRIGEDGWEMVNADETKVNAINPMMIFWFKRPLP